MKRTLIATAALAILPVLGGSQPSERTRPAGTSAAAQQDSTKRQHAAAHDTAKAKAKPKTTAKGKKGNQTESGVVNAKTGASTLGPEVKKTRPDQGQPTTSKGDTLKRGGDSVKAKAKPPV